MGKRKPSVPQRPKLPPRPEHNVGLRLIANAETGSDLTRMTLQQLDRVLAQPESLAEVKGVVSELQRREKD